MAFTTIEGTGGAPWTFQGTSEPDQIAVITGDQVDSVAYSFEANGEEGDDTINWNGVRQVTIRGGQGDDVITNNVATGASVTDIITTSWINGNDGNDVIGNTQLGIAATISTISGGQADDTFYIGNLQTSRVNGNLGDDTLIIEQFFGVRNWANSSVYGGQGDDVIDIESVGSNITDTDIAGQIGDDNITILLQDELDGNGNVVVAASFAGSVITGDEGNDIITGTGSDADLVIEGNDGDDQIFGGRGDDTLSGGLGEDLIDGDRGADSIDAGSGNDTVTGGAGADAINGEDGNDVLSGNDGSDTITGGNGDDVINGGAGADSLTGGTETNRFVQTAGSTGVTTRLFGANQLADGHVLAVAGGADVITDWDAGAGTNFLNTGVVGPVLGLGNAFNAKGNFAVRGDYSADQGTFLITGGGSDIAVWTNYVGNNLRDNFTVLENVALTTVVTENQFVLI